MICTYCGKDLIPEHHLQKVHRECRAEYYKELRRRTADKHRKTHPAHNKEHIRVYKWRHSQHPRLTAIGSEIPRDPAPDPVTVALLMRGLRSTTRSKHWLKTLVMPRMEDLERRIQYLIWKDDPLDRKEILDKMKKLKDLYSSYDIWYPDDDFRWVHRQIEEAKSNLNQIRDPHTTNPNYSFLDDVHFGFRDAAIKFKP